MTDSTVLVVEDDELMREFVEEALSEDGFEVLSASNAEQGFQYFKERRPDLVVADVRMPEQSGLDMLSEIRELDKRIPVVIMTAYAETDTAIEALRSMASDFLKKPFEAPEIRDIVRKHLSAQQDSNSSSLMDEFQPIYASDAMESIVDRARSIADEDGPVLIEGESGVGKEVIARYIHYQGPRGDQPMVTVNCGAIPEQLLESELFGHREGAFTGADEDREGLFLAADGGTLFLDEVGEMPIELQPKLLRALEQGQIKPVGSDQTRSVDVRIIAATNQVLSEGVEAGRFREDLYYRLNVFHLVIPPLRERPEDIRPLLRHFMEDYSVNRELSDEFLDQLEQYEWPGNVRQLQNLVRRMKTMDPVDVLETTDFGGSGDNAVPLDNTDSTLPFPPEPNLEGIVKSIRRRYINSALRESGGNQAEAARILGMNRTTLVEMMNRLDISSDDVS